MGEDGRGKGSGMGGGQQWSGGGRVGVVVGARAIAISGDSSDVRMYVLLWQQQDTRFDN